MDMNTHVDVEVDVSVSKWEFLKNQGPKEVKSGAYRSNNIILQAYWRYIH